MKIGFLGFGEAAFNLAIGLRSEGLSDMIAYDTMENDIDMGKLIKNNAKEAQVALVPDVKELAKAVDIIIIAVPSTYSFDACCQLKPYLYKGQIYADVSASTPAVKSKVWDEIKESGVLFVDAAMMGSLPTDKHKVPITASGNGAEKFKELMSPYKMQIITVGEKAGAASAIKLIRSIYMKGIATLMIEMLQAADHYKVIEEVVGSISNSMDDIPFSSHLDRLVTSSAIHCKRRADELKGSIDMLEEAKIDSGMTYAAKKRLQDLGKFEFAKKFAKEKPSGWQEIVEALRN
jgi:3-hydroxyisobutyrate dehydrogenase-like beta-hydroxyacid dehydrogenase